MKKKLTLLLICCMVISTSLGCANKDDDLGKTSNLGETNNIDAKNTILPAPTALESTDQYKYEYLGLDFKLPTTFNQMIDDQSVFMSSSEALSGDSNLQFAFLYFHLVPDNIRSSKQADMATFNQWIKNTKRIGTIGVFNTQFLSENNISAITGCTENKEIGKSEDGKYAYYLSTNKIEGSNSAELLQESVITTSNPMGILGNQSSFNVFSHPKKNATPLGDFKAQDVKGNEVTKDVFSAYDLTLVNLFTTWCSPCIKEIPDLDAVDKEMANKSVNVIGMVLDVNENGQIDQKKMDILNQIIESTKAEYQIVLPDEVLRSGRLKGVNSVPESFFVDKNGNIVGEPILGSNSKEEWIKLIEEELANLKK